MAVFNYKARTIEGRMSTGTVEAVTESEAAELLSDKGLIVLSLTETTLKKKKSILQMNLSKVSQRDLVIFSRQLSVMIAATVPIVEALRILSQQTINPDFSDKITTIADDVDGGMKLSSALARHSNIFSHFYTSMIKSGETSGKLDEVLEYLADQMEKDYDLMSKIKGAMIYPLFIIFSMIVVGFLMMVFVIPKMTNMLEETGAELPFLTRLLVNVSDFMSVYWVLIIVLFAIAIVLGKLWISSKVGHLAWDALKIKMPIFGNIFKKIYIVRFTRSLSVLIQGGVPITTGLKVTAEVVDNRAYQGIILDTIKEVEDGNSISTIFQHSDLIPKMLSQMMVLGEKTGKLGNVLDRLSKFYTREVDNLVLGLTALIEPIILIIMGVGVGGMVAAIIMPMFQVAQGLA